MAQMQAMQNRIDALSAEAQGAGADKALATTDLAIANARTIALEQKVEQLQATVADSEKLPQETMAEAKDMEVDLLASEAARVTLHRDVMAKVFDMP